MSYPKKRLVLLVTASFVVGAVSFASAESTFREVAASINYGLKMKLNGEEFSPRETDGSAMRPLSYKDRTYLPVRALAEALNVAVDWDAATQTVILGEKEKTTLTPNLFESLRYCEFTTDPDKLFINNQAYTSGLLVQQATGYSDIVAFINTQGKYQKLGFTFATESNKANFKVINEDTGVVLKTIDPVEGGLTKDFEVNIQGAKKIKIESDAGARNYAKLSPTAFTKFYVK